MAANREFDIIVWGITGFTGRLAAKHIAKEWGPSGSKIKYAIAARSAEKLAGVSSAMEQVGRGTGSVPRLQADVNDEQAMVDLCKRTNVLVAMAGPFDTVGEGAVKACVEAGTNYVDITGETHWVKKMYEKYHEQAKRKGIQIVPCCGYDYVISDMTAQHVLQSMETKGVSEVLAVEQVVDAVFAGFSSGTKASMLQGLAKVPLSKLRALMSPYGMCGAAPDSAVVIKKNQLSNSPKYSKSFGCWTAPDVMGMGMTQHFHWGNEVRGFPYGKNVVYGVSAQCPSFFSALIRHVKMQLTGLTLLLLSRFPKAVKQSSGSGPSLDKATGHYVNMKTSITAVVDGETKRFLGEGRMDMDPYVFAAVGSLSAAKAILAETKDNGRRATGVLPPSGAFGKEFCKQLEAGGMKFTVKEV